MQYQWLEWARKLQAIARNGLTYSQNPFEIERLQQVQEVASQILATYTDAGFEEIQYLYKQDAGYATPKVDVRGVVFHQNRLLLVQERLDGGWTLPGGWADVGDSPSAATEREVFEESGYKTRATRLLALYDRSNSRHGHPPHPNHIYKVFFLCTLVDGAPATSIETEAVGWFSKEECASLRLSEGRTTHSQIARLFELNLSETLEADFD
nr:NUDIX hydrolase [Anaerolineae bacterium]